MGLIRTVYMTRLVFSLVLLFLVSTAMSCQELRYMMSGKVVNATSLGAHLEKERSDSEEGPKKLVIGYGFQDGENYRREYADVPVNWPFADKPTVRIQYIPGWERHSRIYGQTNMPWVYIFFGSLIAVAVGVFILARQE